MYDERMITPMRQELTRHGVEEMKTPEEVDAKLKDAKGTTLLVVNSMCGCAARNARPAVTRAIQSPNKPDVLTIDYALNDRGLGLQRSCGAWQQGCGHGL